jgi:hypothetical protein
MNRPRYLCSKCWMFSLKWELNFCIFFRPTGTQIPCCTACFVCNTTNLKTNILLSCSLLISIKFKPYPHFTPRNANARIPIELGKYPAQLLSRCLHFPTLCFLSATYLWGMRWHGWLRHYATNRKVAGSILDEIIGFFN